MRQWKRPREPWNVLECLRGNVSGDGVLAGMREDSVVEGELGVWIRACPQWCQCGTVDDRPRLGISAAAHKAEALPRSRLCVHSGLSAVLAPQTATAMRQETRIKELRQKTLTSMKCASLNFLESAEWALTW